ncbi:MAG: MipA/OmpV family protein [Hyphomonas sp.]
MRATLIFAALTFASLPALAQAPEPPEGWQVTVGAGGLYAPTYQGDDDYALSVLPNLQLKYADTFFASVQDGAGYNLIRSETLKAGPISRIVFSRDEDGDQAFAVSGGGTGDLLGLGDVETSIELGGFLRYRSGPWSAGAELRQAVSGHEGMVLDLNAGAGGVIRGFGAPIIWSAGPRAKIADDTYTSAYFGVTPAQSAASGLPVYSAGGGATSYGFGALGILPLDRDFRWSVVAFAGYDRLTGDAGNSPLVTLRGDADQFSAGVFLSYTFN